MRYSDGLIILRTADLKTPSGTLGHVRSFGNKKSAGKFNGVNGYNNWVQQHTYVRAVNHSLVEVVMDQEHKFWFRRHGTSYKSFYRFLNVQLIEDTINHRLTFIDARDGKLEKLIFHSLTAPVHPGQLISRTSSEGIEAAVTRGTDSRISEMHSSRTVGSVTTTESLQYDHYTNGSLTGYLQSVIYRTQINGGTWTPTKRVTYDYYDTAGSHGSVGDLRSISRQLLGPSGWNTVEVEYNRYWVSDSSTGFAHALKIHLGPEAYRLVVNANLDPATAEDDDLLPYADHYFEYDPVTWAVTKEVAAVCPSCPGGGTTSDLFSRTINPNYSADGFNAWKTKTIQTLPDSSQHIVYTNYVSLPMLMVRIDPADSKRWATFYRYNDYGQPIWEVTPSAVELPSDLSELEVFDDLLNYNPTTKESPYLKFSGLIHVKTFDSFGNVLTEKVRKGQSAETDVHVKSYTYTTHKDSGGHTISVLATATSYPDEENPTKKIITRYAYTWHTGTNRIATRTTTLPPVGTDQHGSGVSDKIIEEFDTYGNLTKRTDERGTVNSYTYDVVKSVITKQVLNYKSSGTGVGVNVTTDFTYDDQGRLVRTLGPAHKAVIGGVATTVRTATFTTYVQSAKPPFGTWDVDQTWTAQGYATGAGPAYTYAIDNPVSITKTDKDGRVTDQITSVRSSGSGALSAGDTFNQTDWQTWSSTQYDKQHRTISTRRYFAIPASGDGTAGTHYGETLYGYDALERRNRVVSPNGTITRTEWETPQRAASISVGTDDAGSNDMVIVTSNQYDGDAAGGDSDLTQVTQYVSGTPSENRVTAYGYDFRNRRVSMTDAVGRYTEYAYDNLDRQVRMKSYATLDGTLYAQGETKYDDRGRVYQTLTYSVDAATGTVGNALAGNTWYDKSGNVIQQIQPGDGQTFTKNAYNGTGWVTASYRGFNPTGTSLSQAGTVANDVILTQAVPTYDEVGNVISQATFDRFHDAPTSGTGSTGALASAAANPKARVSHTATWYDGIGRSVATANYGATTTSFTRPSTPPASSSNSVLVTGTLYDDAGRVQQTTDPKGIATRISYDHAGRTTTKIEAYTGAAPSTDHDRTTSFTYDDAGHLTEIAAINVGASGTSTQRTAYVYGVRALLGSHLSSNDVLSAVQYPDKSTGNASASEQESYAVNRLGERIKKTDRNGTVHQYQYDKLGRLTDDIVATLGDGVDGAVRRIGTTYTAQGQPDKLTSYDAATAGSVVNEVQRRYNGLGQITTEYQAVTGAVDVGSTPKVQYAYSELPSGANHSRLTNMTYPNGRVLTYAYGTSGSLNNALNRLTAISDPSATLETYQYLGLGTVVERDHPEPDLKLTYIGTGTGDAGDQYVGLDRFGRVVDQNWTQGTAGSVDRYAYGYDANGNVLWKANDVNDSFSELYTYDNLNRLVTMGRGELNTAKTNLVTNTVTRSQAWALDALGNSDSVTSDGTNEVRVHNRQNQLTMVGNTRQAFDKDGSLRASGLPADFDHNGVVDFNDFLVLQSNFGGTGKTWEQGDGDGDGAVNFNDYLVLQNQFGQSAQAVVYTYDAWSRVANCYCNINSVSGDVRFLYDGFNRRVARANTTFYFDVDWKEIERRDNDAAVEASYIWSPVYIDAMIARVSSTSGNSSQRLYAIQEINYNVNAVTDVAGVVVQQYQYDAYGDRAVLDINFNADSNISFEHGRQGAAYDPLLKNLMLLRNRMYDTGAMRWLQGEPEGGTYQDGFNLYAYPLNPIGEIDPAGRQTIAIPVPRFVPRVTPRPEVIPHTGPSAAPLPSPYVGPIFDPFNPHAGMVPVERSYPYTETEAGIPKATNYDPATNPRCDSKKNPCKQYVSDYKKLRTDAKKLKDQRGVMDSCKYAEKMYEQKTAYWDALRLANQCMKHHGISTNDHLIAEQQAAVARNNAYNMMREKCDGTTAYMPANMV